MSGASPPLVKICGMMRRADAEAAAAAGADFIGVILAPGGRRSVTPAAAGIILHGLPIRRVGVFVNADVAELASAAVEARLDVLQLHGDEPPELGNRLRALGYTVWKALRPRSGEEFAEAAPPWAAAADALLLDGYSPDARGGTGHGFPWAEVARRLDALPAGTRLIAAGGLRPDNVAEAVRMLSPFAVDVSSGVEAAPGVKDPAAIRSFIRAARGPHARSTE